jgi:hypothetical protein
VKRAALFRSIQTAADEQGKLCVLVRQGRRHEFWEVSGMRFADPRHREIKEWTAEAILRELESIFGEGWWRS